MLKTDFNNASDSHSSYLFAFKHQSEESLMFLYCQAFLQLIVYFYLD